MTESPCIECKEGWQGFHAERSTNVCSGCEKYAEWLLQRQCNDRR